MNTKYNVGTLTDQTLLSKADEFCKKERELLVEVLVYLKEIDKRKLYLGLGYTSLFSYCTDRLHYSESAAFRRIEACRMLGKYRGMEENLQEGKITLTTLLSVKPLLTEENSEKVFEQIANKSKREVEIMAMGKVTIEKRDWQRNYKVQEVKQFEIKNQENKKVTSSGVITKDGDALCQAEASVLAIGVSKDNGNETELEKYEIRTRVGFSVGDTFMKDLEKAKQILSHKYPGGKMEDVMGEVLAEYVKRHDPAREVKNKRVVLPPLERVNADEKSENKNSREISAEIRRQIWQRDNGICQYIGTNGKVCSSRYMIEIDHIVPVALGGESIKENLRLLCRSHNQYMAEKYFGKRFMENYYSNKGGICPTAQETRESCRSVVTDSQNIHPAKVASQTSGPTIPTQALLDWPSN